MQNPYSRFFCKNLNLLIITICILTFSFTHKTFANDNLPIETTAICNFAVFDHEGFESGWGSLWNDGGSDCYRNYEPALGANGSNYCIRIRDNSGAASSLYTNNLDCSSVQEIKVDFMYSSESMESGEDFLLECSTDGGLTFWTAKQWTSGIDFSNGGFNLESISFTGSFTSNTLLRFRCDASSNYDKIFLDEIHIEFCSGNTPVDPCASLGGDTDGDGYCDHNDCQPNDLAYPATPGTACDDNDNNTENDVVTADGCGCAGTIIVVHPCASLGGDSDNDGTCDHDDCAPSDPHFPKTPGTACNDNDPGTDNDVITADGCGCAGTPINTGGGNNGGACTYIEYSFDGFESGWGNWIDGGSDCKRNYEVGTGAGGSNYCISTRDNSGKESSFYSTIIDLSQAVDIKIDFWYLAKSMESNEDFYLEFSNDGGSSYSTIQKWKVGEHFYNNTPYNESVSYTGVFNNNCRFRFRCDASSNYDHVYFDDISIKICTGTTNPPTDPCATLGGDSDGDGFCDHNDCQPNDMAYPATPGTACDDNDNNTENDVVTFDGCGCAGTIIVVHPCAGLGGDSDNDGTCDDNDCHPNDNFYPAAPGSVCNDYNPQTENDVVTADGCGCAGTLIDNGGGQCQYIELSHDDFESSWGFWNDGGSDCYRNYEAGTGAGGSNYCIRTRDNSGHESSLFSDKFDASSAAEIMINFWYAAHSMELNEDFYLELSTNGGSSYTTVGHWVAGTHFQNGFSGYDAVSFAGPFSSSCRLRFRCDASSNYDIIYIDDITIKLCQGGGPADPCAGLGGDSDGDGVCDQNDICNGGDDNIDLDGNGIPDFCDIVIPPNCNLAVDLGADINTCWTEATIVPTITGQSSCNNSSCNVQAQELISWSLDACRNYNDAYDYSEFTPQITALGTCSNVYGSIVKRNSPNTNFHSCVKGVNGYGYGMCISANTSSYINYNGKTVKFNVTLSPGQIGQLSKLEFYELSPEHVSWESSYDSSDYKGRNNRPTKYGLRVLKNGSVIYTADNNHTTTSWSLESFDFSSDPAFQVNSTTTFTFELVAYAAIGNGENYSVWDLDNIKIFGGCCTPTTNSALSYAWSGPGNFSSTDSSIAAIETGVYSVTVTDCNGCMAVDNVTLNSDVFSITCPADVAVSCQDSSLPAATGLATTSGDNCGATTITYTDMPSGGCGIITRTWSATAGGKTQTCVQTITINAVATTIDCPSVASPGSATLLGCNPMMNGNVPNQIATQLTGTDCTGAIDITTFSDVVMTNGCEKTLTRTFSVFDNCNNSTITCDLVYIWSEDLIEPVVSCANAAGGTMTDLGCNPDLVNNLPIGLMTTATGTDNCLDGVTDITSYDDVLTVDNCTSTLVRTWSLADACNNVGTCSFTYTWSQSSPIMIDCPTAPIVIECGEFPLPQLPAASSPCGLVGPVTAVPIEYQSDILICNGPVGEYTYTATDLCGITASCTQIIELVSPEPTLVCPQELVINCIEAYQPGTAQVMESCDYLSSVEVGLPILQSGNAGCDGAVYLVSYSLISHPCGYAPVCDQRVVIEMLPEGINCTDEVIVVECVDDIVVENEVYTTACGEEIILMAGAPVYTGNGTAGCNSGTYEVRIEATLSCGTLIGCTRVFEVINEGYTINCATGSIAFCNLEDFIPEPALVSAPCLPNPVPVTFSGFVDNIDCGGSIEVSYVFDDGCFSQNFTCSKTVTAPPAAVIDCPTTAIAFCEAQQTSFLPLATYRPGCGGSSPLQSSQVISDNSDCLAGGTLELLYEYNFGCDVASQLCTVTVLPAGLPTFSCPTADPVAICNLADYEPIVGTIELPCGEFDDVLGVKQNFVGDCDSGGIQNILYSYSDSCFDAEFSCSVNVEPVNNPPLTCPTPNPVNVCNVDSYTPKVLTGSFGCTTIAAFGNAGLYAGDCTGGTIVVTYDINTADCGAELIECVVNVDPAPASVISCPVVAPVAACDVATNFVPADAEVLLGCGGTQLVNTVSFIGLDGTCLTGGTVNITYVYESACETIEENCQIDFLPAPMVDITCPPNSVVSCIAEVVPGIATSESCLDGEIIATIPTILPAGCNGQTVDITYTATDFCSQSTSCIQTISIQNNGVVITCPPNLTVNCGDTNDIGEPTASSSCGIDFSFSPPNFLTDTETGCPPSIIEVEHKVTDLCGNTDACIQTIANNIQAPDLSCSDDGVAACIDDIENIFVFNVFNPCNVLINAPTIEIITNGQLGCSGDIIEAQATLTDACNNISQCIQLFTIQNAGPTLNCPVIPPVSFCDIETYVPPTATVAPACGMAIEVMGTVDLFNLTCAGGIFDINYDYTGCNNNDFVCSVVIEPPVAEINCPTIAPLAYCDFYTFDQPDAEVTLCNESFFVPATLNPIQLNCNGTTYDLTYNFIDCSSNNLSCTTTVTLTGITDIECPQIAPVQYCDLANFTAPMSPTGACDFHEVVSSFDAGNVLCTGGSFDVIYSYTDCNFGSAVCNVIVEPANIEAAITCPANFVVECNDITGIADWFALAQAVDGCTNNILAVENNFASINLPAVSCNAVEILLVEFTTIEPVCTGTNLSCTSSIEVQYPAPELSCSLPPNQAECVPGEIAVTCSNEKGFKTYCFEFIDVTAAAAFEANAATTITVGMDDAILLPYVAGDMEVCYKTVTKGSCNLKDFREAFCPGNTNTVFSFANVAEVDTWVAGLETTITVIGGCGATMPLLTSDHINGAQCVADIQTVTFTVTDECGNFGTCAIEYQIESCGPTCSPCGILVYTCDPAGAGGIKRFCATFPNESDAEALVTAVENSNDPILLGSGNNAVEVVLESSLGGEVCFLSTGNANCDQDNADNFENFVLNTAGCCFSSNLVDNTNGRLENTSGETFSFTLDFDQPKTIVHSKIAVYPNPVLGELYLNVDAKSDSTLKGIIYSNVGEIVHQISERPLSKGININKVDLHDMTPGAYFLRIEIGNEIFYEKITVINK